MAKTYRVECEGCGVEFEARSPRAKWHSPACKKAAQRRPAAAAEERSDDEGKGEEKPVYRSNLVAALRKKLSDAGVFDTFEGQLAIELAGELIRDGSGSGRSKDLRAVVAEAMALSEQGDGGKPTGGDDDQGDPADDELAAVRKKRDRKTRKAADRA